MTPVWLFFVNCLPMWVAPNLITMVGFTQLIICFCMTVYYSPTLTETLPPWLLFVNGCALWLRQCLDAMDGKQARRTGASTPVGEFFDHGLCDALELLFVAYCAAACCKLGAGYLFFFFVLGGMGSHFLEMWAVYLTSKIEFWYFSFTESEDLGIATHFVVWYLGQDVVDTLVPGTNVRVVEALFYITLVQFALAFYGCLARINKFIAPRPAAEKSKILSWTSPLFYVLALGSLWIYQSPRLLVELMPPFIVVIGCLLANGGCRFVTARVCKEEPAIFYNMSIPLIFGVINAGGRIVDEKTFVYLYCFYAIVAYAHYGYCIIVQMANELKIRVFHIADKPRVNSTRA